MSTPNDIKDRLEYLRGELRAERMSYGELVELQDLASHIEDGDVELLEAAGVPEHEATQPQPPQVREDDDTEYWRVQAYEYKEQRDDLHRQVKGLLASELALQAQRDDLQARVSGLEGQLAIAEQSKVELLAALQQALHASYGNKGEAQRIMQAAIARATSKQGLDQ